MKKRRKIVVCIAMSTDGFIERPDGDVAWLDRGRATILLLPGTLRVSKGRGTMAIDPAQERKRLMDVYSHMTDGELQELAEDTASLTGLASQVLNDEMARRELSPLQPGPSQPDPDGLPDETALRTMVTIRSFPDVMQAWLAKSGLESAGIECYLVDDNMVRLDWGISIVLGGVKLRVKPEDAEAALEFLDQPVPEEVGDDNPE